MKMDLSRLMASTATALDKLQDRRKQCSDALCEMNKTIDLGIIMRWIRVVRTFFLCSTTLDGSVELRIEANNVDAVTSRRSRKKRMKQKKRTMRKGLESLLVRVENVVRRILDDRIPYEPFGFQYDMESLEEEMDKWYTRLSDYLRQYSTSPRANQIKVITVSVLENLKDYLSTQNYYDYQLLEQVQLIESVIKNISFLINFTRFGTLLCAENQEFQHSLTQIELLAIGAAHFTLHLFSNVRGMPLPNDLTKSMVNPFLHEAYASALASLKLYSQESHNPTLDLNDYPFIIIIGDFTVSLLSTLWEMLQFNTAPVVSLKEKLLTVYEGLRDLRNILKNQPDKFDDDKIRNITVAAICEAGVMIFSLYQKGFAIDHADQKFLETVKVIRLEVEGHMVKKSFPQTDVLGFIDFLLEDCMVEVEGSKVDSDILSFVPKIQEYLFFLKSFVGNLLELRNQQKNAHQDLWNLAIEVAYKIEFLIDQLVLGDDTPYSFSRSLQSITEDIMAIKDDSLNIFYEIQEITWPSTDKAPSVISNSSPVADEVVGFKSEKTSVINRLMGGLNRLQVVAVVGMPGLGKTTLATKVYRDPSVAHHFHVKAWCFVSRVFDRRKVLLELLNQIQPGESNLTRNEEDLSQQLWRSLRKRKYLIFVDDIWDIESFNLLRESLPDDSNQSRILLTSRHSGVFPEALHDDKPLFLRHLTVDESLELLQKKLFPAGKDWPPALHEFGMEIAEHCKGLPLTVVIIAGLLKTTEQEGWNDVLKTLRSSIISDFTDQCVSTIELSYQHLPDYLKPCFLWFGAFPEDHEVSVKKLTWIWIAEGLVRKSELKSLEDVAADYLKDLIGRSLVMIVKERTTGGIKACRIHDLLHDFCLRKGNDDHFLHLLKLKGKREPGHMSSDEFEVSSFYEPNHLFSGEPDNLRRLCLYTEPGHFQNYKLFFPRLISLLFFTPVKWPKYSDLAFIVSIHKLLRVLDMEKVFPQKLPCEVGLLVQLRYLAFQVTEYVCPAIGKLSNLETLVLYVGVEVVSLPDTLWNLRKLRHLYSKCGSIELPIDNPDSCNLLKLETLSNLCVRNWIGMEKQLKKFPNIRQMKCQFHLHKDGYVNDSKVMDFSFLSQLESLSLCCFSYYSELIFPEKIKKLTLTGAIFPWITTPSIAKLPYLEVFKLLQCSFFGDTWHVEEGEFSKLKYLKLQSHNLVNWTAASDDLFSNLEKLVLVECYKLDEVPECLENVTTLETIEVIDCPDFVVCLVKKVDESQKEMGNSVLQFHERRTGTFSSGDEFSNDE